MRLLIKRWGCQTTTCINLGASLAYHARRVLIIDMDPQAHLLLVLVLNPTSFENNFKCTEPNRSPFHLELNDAIIQLNPNLYIAPSNIDLAGEEYRLIDKLGREDF